MMRGGLKPPRKEKSMRTKEILEKMPSKNRAYLETLRSDMQLIEQRRDSAMVKEIRAVGRGYIKALVDCGVIDDFKIVWCWFTL
jgi:hypothetical protein